MSHVDALSRNPVESSTEDEEINILQVGINESDWILSVQLQDSHCKYLHEVLSRVPENKEEDVIHKEYTLKDNRIYRITPSGRKWVVPKVARREIVMQNHDYNGHFALEKTLESIRKSFWFPSMMKYVKNYIACCLPCSYNKKPTGKQEGYLHPIEKGTVPMDTIHIDHLGPFVKSKRRNSYLITAVDAFTKFIFMKPVISTKTGPVISFLKEIIETFGVPRRLICDRGSCFTSKKFAEFCHEYGIKVTLNATATPRANGQMERYNRTILSAISCSSDDESKWDKTITQIRFGLNNTVNTTTGKSPYELLLGYRPRGWADAYLRNEVDIDETVRDITSVRYQAAERTAKVQKERKERYDVKRRSPRHYEVGQQVLLRKVLASNDGKSKKVLPNYSGPYLVTKVLPHDRYIIEDLPGAQRAQKAYKGVSSVDKLKLFNPTMTINDDLSSSNDEDAFSPQR